MNLVIRNGTLVNESLVFKADIGIKNGQIACIAKKITVQGEKEIDATGLLIFPGMIDSHVHFHDKNFIKREDFNSASIAAACGGIASVVEMPTDCPLVRATEIKKKISQGEKLSFIDFAMHAGNMTAKDVTFIPEMVSCGVTSFKAFTAPPYKMNDGAVISFMKEVKKNNGIALFHCENGDIIDYYTAKYKKKGNKAIYHSLSRPNIAEAEAITRIILFAEHTGCHAHVVHISSLEGANLLKTYKNKVKLTGEVTPHHLIFTKEKMNTLGSYGKMNPPLRTKEDNVALWDALCNGTIDMVTTDHFASYPKEKEVSIWDAPPGLPSVETVVPLLFSEGVNKKRLSLTRFAEVMSVNPAKIFGIYPQKGSFAVGTDADFTIINPRKTQKITADKLHYRVGWTPFDGMKVKGVPVYTIIRGNILSQDNELMISKPDGKYIPRNQ